MRLAAPMFVVCAFAYSAPPPLTAKTQQQEEPGGSRGESLFNQHCARCHGFGASGGEGPSLKRAQFQHSADDETFASIIRDGIPGTDMPGTWQLSASEIQEVVDYVNTGRTNERSEPPDGVPKNGQGLFDSKGCSICHMIDGIGGGVGPDLSNLGHRRGLEHISVRPHPSARSPSRPRRDGRLASSSPAPRFGSSPRA